jgi:superfamily I DNA and/or RNA helicase
MVIDAANSRKPQDILIQAADTEASILSKEAAKKRRLMPIRTLMQKIPNLLVKLKPCLLMSPISVSQFLPPDMKFDLVLFDEASQLVPEDAISAIYRGKTIVVAGDNKQLPPTSLSSRRTCLTTVDWDELSDEDIEVFDSILDECLGIGLPVKT